MGCSPSECWRRRLRCLRRLSSSSASSTRFRRIQSVLRHLASIHSPHHARTGKLGTGAVGRADQEGVMESKGRCHRLSMTTMGLESGMWFATESLFSEARILEDHQDQDDLGHALLRIRLELPFPWRNGGWRREWL